MLEAQRKELSLKMNAPLMHTKLINIRVSHPKRKGQTLNKELLSLDKLFASSNGVVLLNGFNIKPLQFHYRLNMTLERVELPQPGNKTKWLI